MIGALREEAWSSGVMTSKLRDGKQEAGAKFSDYFDFSEPLNKLPSHRILAAFRGREGRNPRPADSSRAARAGACRREFIRTAHPAAFFDLRSGAARRQMAGRNSPLGVADQDSHSHQHRSAHAAVDCGRGRGRSRLRREPCAIFFSPRLRERVSPWVSIRDTAPA